MAKAPAARPSAPLPLSSKVPPPPDLASLGSLTVWKAHVPIHRIHPDAYGAAQFNPSLGNARFSPIRSTAGTWVPTLYGATSFDGAAMETVYHDIPHVPGLKTFSKMKFDNKSYSVLDPQVDLKLLDLTGLGLRRTGVQPKDLIDTEKDTYPQTRQWAEVCHAQCPTSQGMVWVSRQHNTTLAIVLFEDRITLGTLTVSQFPQSISLPALGHYANLLTLARRIGVDVV